MDDHYYTYNSENDLSTLFVLTIKKNPEKIGVFSSRAPILTGFMLAEENTIIYINAVRIVYRSMLLGSIR